MKVYEIEFEWNKDAASLIPNRWFHACKAKNKNMALKAFHKSHSLARVIHVKELNDKKLVSSLKHLKWLY